MHIMGFEDYRAQALALSIALQTEYREIRLHSFPDGESLVQVPVNLPDHVVLVRSLNQPNSKLIELLLSVSVLRKHGARRITLVAPYLCYMRQDAENHPGEAVSQQVIGRLLADNFDDVITVDPHLHRVQRLVQAIPARHALAVTAGGEIGRFLQQQYADALLVGPDSESEQWVSEIAITIGFSYTVASKVRSGDKQVAITLPERDYAGQHAVLVDDMASTGHTLAQAAENLLHNGARQVDAVVTHPLFCSDAEQVIRQSGVTRIWSSDSITHSTNAIQLANVLAEAVRQIV
ncbi:ribose-phosphate pyrophosphokinase [Nitrosomonas marina]|uniref:Ribose-phosphate pyrophosphokinase n=1 Tax=Nitrosomonas marina TaxID=917 RepID=A0A1H9YJ84_9PROT|nr:ribose-phosphate diphosphokinase [Nitrosomonas marina]SES68641.1 ribose-phosphate pyrophosphokinase [Nitrosomonas marina]